MIHDGGTPWWVPLLVGLCIATVAAGASYVAAWWFKKRDIERESAVRAADLVDQAEQLLANRQRFATEGGAATVTRFLQEARVRAQPLLSRDLEDRFQAALSYAFNWGLWNPGPEPVGARHWLAEAVANIREGLVPYLSAPRFLPFATADANIRSFPTINELKAMPQNATQELIVALAAWKERQV